MDGMAVTRYIRDLESKQGDGRRTPILGLSAHATEEVRQQCLDAGMDGFLIKPVEPAVILKTIEGMMA